MTMLIVFDKFMTTHIASTWLLITSWMFAFTSWMVAFTRIRTVTFIITAVVIPIFLGVQSLITIGAVAMVIVFAKYMATVSYIAHITGLWQTVL
ncbi:MAG: hypothetical protein QF551_06550, partial [Candidatus Marinimicrobia bacterium]|nr:hypothetical protein [Candidatus Neomarinimicrobiota bacterium]